MTKPTKDIIIKTLATGGLLDQEIANVSLMGSDEEIKWNRNASGLTIQLPNTPQETLVSGFRIICN
ncbi:hypothetical protein [Neorhodopirellula pilleata]|uniref:hypothetical protein n=1 Tax=Neorhodopirellula pilleata TaxID=2714738 RepID=UPI001E64202E|nr:hypothetical protein [Neorhodopirellula pilleata]